MNGQSGRDGVPEIVLFQTSVEPSSTFHFFETASFSVLIRNLLVIMKSD
jgi:hypothetical protein